MDKEPRRIGQGLLAPCLCLLILCPAALFGCFGGGGGSYTIGGTVTGLAGTGLVLQDNGGDNLPVSASGTFTFPSKVDDGSGYTVTVLTQPASPAQHCLVTNGTASVKGANVTNVIVNCLTLPRVAYVVSGWISPTIGANTVSAYTIKPATGALVEISGSPYVTGILPSAAVSDPQGKFLYVTASSVGEVWSYAIDAVTGALTRLAGTVPTGSAPSWITLDPAGKFAYVANALSQAISVYAVDATSGALTPVPGSTFTGTNSTAVTVDPTGHFVYAVNGTDGTVSGYAIDATSGALTPIAGSPFAAGKAPVAVAVEPAGKFAYVANLGGPSTISVYAIDPASGALTPITGSPFASASRIQALTIDPRGHVAYAANYFDGTVSAFSIDATTGALTTVTGSPFTAGLNPSFVTVDPSGQFAYVVNRGDSTVSVYAIDATSGALTAIGGSPFSTGVQAAAIAVSR